MKAKFTMNITLTEGRDQVAIDWLRTQSNTPQDIIRQLLREAATRDGFGQVQRQQVAADPAPARTQPQPVTARPAAGGDVPVASFGGGSAKPAASGLLGGMLDQG